nr:hypothetical protein [Tanacetum cinerariifolium]
MADVNVNAPADQSPTMAPPTRTDDQILPHIRWCQLDEQWFDLTKDTLRDALQITPVNNNNAFSAPSTPDALINFVNDLGYPKVVRNLFDVILWGVVNRAHIDYAERIWEEVTQSIHTFIEEKKNLAQHTHEKKKATLIVISSVRFTKLIIYYLQSKHKFYSRPDSLLYLPNKEPAIGYLKFSETYYKEYLEKVAKHQRYLVGKKGSDPDSPAPKPVKATKKSKPYLVGKKGSDPDSPAPKPVKATKKSKPSVPKVDLRPPVTKPASSQQPRPKPAPAKSQGKKRKLVTETSNKPSPARRSKPGLGTGRSLKSVYDAPPGPLPPVVIREPDSGKYQPLPEVQRKSKEKVSDEQVALDLLTLQTPKKKSPANQFIFQRHTSTPTESSGHNESSSLYAELGLIDSEVESDEDVPGIDAGVQNKGQAGQNPGEQDEGQTGPNLGDAVVSQPQSSPLVHAGPNLKHADLEATYVST